MSGDRGVDDRFGRLFAMDWLNRFGAEFGLCQIYANEAWHFEYVPGVTDECPPQLLDSTAG